MTFDFIVIGGGIAGLSSGARLTRLGSVLLLEREADLGYHSSGRSAAMFEENYGLPSTVALTRASRVHHQTRDGGVLSPRGFLVVGTKSTASAFDADCRAFKLDDIGGAAARELVPILATSVDRAGFEVDAWDIDTDRLMQGYAREIRRGGEIRTGWDVGRITSDGADWQVASGEARVRGRVLVNAAGAWADQVATLAGVAPVGLTPHRRSMARLKAPAGHDVGRWPMVLGAGEDWYFKPDAGALIVSPADEDPVEPQDVWADDMVLAEGLARYRAHVSVPVTRPIATWAGLRTFAPDRQLVLGPEPDMPSFVWCAGQGGYGFQSAPAAAQLIADCLGGQAPEIGPETARALSPSRFR